ncbi:MAG: c-type cytochrome biogenesis protein CcsB, partial [Streptomycetales bacterium]
MAINETLAQLSDNFVYSAMAVYSGAMLAFAGEWAFGSRSPVGRRAAATGGAQSESREPATREPVPAAVAAGAAATGAPAAGHD